MNDFSIQPFALTDSSNCATSLTPATLAAPGLGGLLSTEVGSAANCVFLVRPDVNWIQSTYTYGAGPFTLNILARPNNDGSARTGTVTVGAQKLTLTQEAAPAAVNFTPLSFRCRWPSIANPGTA